MLLLVVSLGLQPLLSAKVTRIDDQGRTVLVCTLKGLSVLSLVGDVSTETTDSVDCPVCTLNTALATALPGTEHLWQIFPPSFRSVKAYAQPPIRGPTEYLPPLRAPPAVSLS
ncbi:MAG: hypothetical protein OQK12_12355 [Motiliproteus sp.]|nr:hypothetical protein [Motiliproteus sp.]MCW9051927.1 hypothetical protein [Motiliproteus sp.]